jgi:hypothetical protein
MNRGLKFSAITIASLVLAACGGSGSSGSGGGADIGGGGGVDVAGGGIGGTSAGTITGFNGVVAARNKAISTIELNSARTYDVKPDTTFSLDDDNASASDLEQGMVVDVDLKDDTNDDLTKGSLRRVLITTAVRGPVTSVRPLRVLEQEIVTDTTTVLPASFSLANLKVGDIVEVHGQREAGSTTSESLIRASFLRTRSNNTPQWVLTGPVSNLIPNTSFTIGNQTVLISGVEINDCRAGLRDGDKVRVKATADGTFLAGQNLDTVTRVRCRAGVRVPDDFNGSNLKASVEGIVDSVASSSQFTLGGQTINVTTATRFERGTPADIIVGARLEAEGRLDVAKNQLQASKIQFRESRFRVEGPISASSVTQDTITLFGLGVKKFARTRDVNNVYGGIIGPRQVLIEGFLDGKGVAYARLVRLQPIDTSDYEVRGPLGELSASLQTFKVLGITVDATNARFEDDEKPRPRPLPGRRDGNDSDDISDDITTSDDSDDDTRVTTSQAFFAAAKAGQPVKVSGGDYNASTNTISNAVIELED